MPDFDHAYWDSHWQEASGDAHEPNPYLGRELAGLAPGTALDAGCGAGSEALWLAAHGWAVTAADISGAVLARAAARAPEGAPVTWVEADLTTWEPGRRYDLVTTSYAHPAMPQLEFYDRIAGWVAPGGTLLIVGHRHHGDHHPAEATATATDIVARLDRTAWRIDTADEPTRGTLRDVVVRATRR